MDGRTRTPYENQDEMERGNLDLLKGPCGHCIDQLLADAKHINRLEATIEKSMWFERIKNETE